MRRLILLLAVVGLSVTGCQSYWPRLRGTGPVNAQRIQASRRDPYPSTYLAPEIVGGRPPGYQRSYPEAVRHRHFWENVGLRAQ